MNVLATSAAVTIIVFLAGIIGLHLNRLLPESHVSEETHDIVKLGTGMLSVLAALVLGLMIHSVKTSFDTKSSAVRTYATDLIVLDKMLRDYGGQALAARRELRDYTTRLLNDVWRSTRKDPFFVENREAADLFERVWNSVRELPANSRDQQVLVNEALPDRDIAAASALAVDRASRAERAAPGNCDPRLMGCRDFP
jgi:hypothetical protein